MVGWWSAGSFAGVDQVHVAGWTDGHADGGA